MSGRTTLFALSTPRGPGGIAVIRVSGPDAGPTLEALAGRLPAPRHARLCRLADPSTGEIIDQAIVLWFPAPNSFTGDDVAEFQVHGSPAVISGVLSVLAGRPGLTPAEPGGFTRRAFENGRLDLTAVEGLADLIAAETPAQRRQAFRQLDGALFAVIENWRGRIVRLMALFEAEIDFSDEDLPENLLIGAEEEARSLCHEMTDHLATADRGERLRAGYQVALLGPPNVGKSTLLNALAKRDVAIVTDEPGTTRDIIEAHFDLGGYPVTIADMAGFRDDPGTIEALGIARATRRADEADLRIGLVEASDPPESPRYGSVLKLLRSGDLVVRSKADTGDLKGSVSGYQVIPVSAPNQRGLNEVIAAIQSRAEEALTPSEAPALTRLRHRQVLEECISALGRFEGLGEGASELRAEELRLAARALGRMAGRVDVEDILDVVFASFCIGK